MSNWSNTAFMTHQQCLSPLTRCTLPVDPMPVKSLKATQFSAFSSVLDLRVPAFHHICKATQWVFTERSFIPSFKHFTSISGQLNRQDGPSVQCRASSHYLATIWCTAVASVGIELAMQNKPGVCSLEIKKLLCLCCFCHSDINLVFFFLNWSASGDTIKLSLTADRTC